MNENARVDVGGVPETMLQTMYARAKETRKKHPVIRDEKAVEIVEKLDYDFSLADKDAPMGSGVIARTIVLDRLTTHFLAQHPGTVVVNIACGLDTRCYRNEGHYSRWYNIDLPQTMAIRQRFMPEEGKITQLAVSAMDPSWAQKIQQTEEPVLVIIEGLTMYLSEEDVRQIFTIIDERFAQATVFVEIMNPHMVKMIKEKSIEKSEAKFTWGVKNGSCLEKLVPAFRSVEDHSLVEGMEEFIPIYKLIGKIPAIRNISNKIAVLKK